MVLGSTFEFDAKDIVFARIDRRRKLPVTTLLYSLGLDQEGIMDAYYDTVEFTLKKNKGWVTKFFPERVRGTRPTMILVDAKTGEVIAEANKKVTPRAVKKLIDAGRRDRSVDPIRCRSLVSSSPRTSSTKKRRDLRRSW